MKFWQQNIAGWLGLGLMLPTLLLGQMLLGQTRAEAANQVVFKYQIFRRSVGVDELTTLAQTGEAPSELNSFLHLSRQDPQKVREVLTKPIEINYVQLDRFLNSPLGDVLLGQLSQYFYTPSTQASRAAMRAALVKSAADDNRVTLLEVLQNYPTSAIQVDGDRLVAAYNNLHDWSKRISGLGGLLHNIQL